MPGTHRQGGALASFAGRIKLVTFRLTQEEYEAVKNLCLSRGVRSISEFTREAIRLQLGGHQSRAFVSPDLISLGLALEQIDVALKDLSGKIARVLGPVDRG
jgi:hypothetical protein